MCAAPLVLPQMSRLSVTELMASVANGFADEAERSTALWWIWVIEMDEPASFKEVESIL